MKTCLKGVNVLDILWNSYMETKDKEAFCMGLTAKQKEHLGDKLCRGAGVSERHLRYQQNRNGVLYQEDINMETIGYIPVYLSISKVQATRKGKTLLRLLCQGFTIAEIAAQCGVTKNAIYKRIHTLTRCLDNDEEACIKALLLEVFGVRAIKLIN